MPRKYEGKMTDLIAQDAAAGNYRTVDIAAERKKATLTDQEVFAEKLSLYTLKDYLQSDDPYLDLLQYSRGQVGLFEQLAYVLMDTAKEQMHAKNNSPYNKKIKEKIAFTKDIYLADLTEATSILDYINKVEADPETADKVSVLPLMCGTGKSTAITLKIKEVIEHGAGLLIVTDNNDRLYKLWDENTENPLLGEDIKAFIKAHKDDVTVMAANTYVTAAKSQWKHPVLIMTTQRFFNILTRDEIQKYLKWKDKGTRPLILFDEEPYLNEIFDLTPKSVNDIDTKLRMLLDDSNTEPEDKQWCVQQWEAFREKFLGLLWEYEYDHDGQVFYYEDEQHSLTEDDDRFFNILNQCRTVIRSDNTEIFKNLYAFKTLVNNWGVYSLRKSGAYESKFTVFLDNRDKIQELGAKVIVLDGTGDISPMYAGQDYIDLRSGENYVRSLSHLTIKTGDIDTSKASLSERNSPVPDTITDYLNEEEDFNDENTYIFTYKGKEDQFGWYRTAHFGAIKGLNEYMDAKCIAQVGLNELQPVHYLVHILARDEELRTRLTRLSPEESCEQIQKMLNEDCAEFKIAHLLADIDQNMFRSAIRSAKNRKDIVFYLFYKYSHIPQLQKALRERYCGLLGGHFETVSADTLAEYKPSGKETLTDKIYKWYCDWDGSPKKRETIAAEIGISADVLKTTIYRDTRLRSLFEQAKEAGKEIKGKNGWYAKREHK